MGKNRENSGSAKNNEEFEREQEKNPKLSYYDDRDDWEKNKHHFRLVSFWEDGIKHEGVYNDRIIRPLYIAGWEGKIIDHGSEFGADIHEILFGARANEGRKPFDSKVGCTENRKLSFLLIGATIATNETQFEISYGVAQSEEVWRGFRSYLIWIAACRYSEFQF